MTEALDERARALLLDLLAPEQGRDDHLLAVPHAQALERVEAAGEADEASREEARPDRRQVQTSRLPFSNRLAIWGTTSASASRARSPAPRERAIEASPLENSS